MGTPRDALKATAADGASSGPEPASPWHARSRDDVVRAVGSDSELGLPEVEAEFRLAQAGPNELPEPVAEPWWKQAAEALTEPLVLLLLAVGVLYAIFGEREEATTIFAVIVAVAAIETVNEARAKRAIASLSQLSPPEATVIRDGQPRPVAAKDLVPGDLVLLEAGRRAPADIRLLETAALRVDESTLTGESMPADKDANAGLPPDAPLGDRRTMAFTGTLVTGGGGRGVVVETASRTMLGRIAGLAASAREPRTPLQQQQRELAAALLWLAIGFSVLVPALSILIGGRPWRAALLEGLTLAFATIPEELPILVTIVLGIGAYRLAREHAITRRLQAAETLGRVSVIATDKTGTLTENRMLLAALYVEGKTLPIDRVATSPAAKRLLEIGALATGAQVRDGQSGDARFLGDPTDVALLQGAETAGVLGVRQQVQVERVIPFDDLHKRVAVVYNRDGDDWLALKGAPEIVLSLSTSVGHDGAQLPLDEDQRNEVRAAIAAMAESGQRVIGAAERRLSPAEFAQGAPAEQDLTFVGLAGLQDPPRPEAAAAVAALGRAGIRVIMVTGDHPATAKAIGSQVGIVATDVVEGARLEGATLNDIAYLLRQSSVFARITPEQKLRIVQALQGAGEVVAVTGDGVNDAPALRQAEIGVAMGHRGSDVAREAADLVLSDDNFATVVSAVRGGRLLYDNLRKAVRYYLAAKVGLISASLAAVLAGLPVPFAPIQIIVLELFMDLGASTTFVVEPLEEDAMSRPPRSPRRRFLDRPMVTGILGGGVALGAAVLVVYAWATRASLGEETARSAAFATWMIGHLVLAAHMRSDRPLLRGGFRFTLPFAIWGFTVAGLLLLTAFVPSVGHRLHLVSLPSRLWAIVVTAGVVLPSCFALQKWLVRSRQSGDRTPRSAQEASEARAEPSIRTTRDAND